MNNRFRFSRRAKYFIIALIIPSLSILNSCKQSTGGEVGVNILPKSDIISTYETDTATLYTSMYLKNLVPTNSTAISMLGSYNDPIFGPLKTSIYASIFSNVSGTPPWVDSGVGAGVDSVVLLLPFYNSTSYYGNLDPQTIVVNTLQAPIATHVYYSDTSVPSVVTPIAIQQITPNPAGNGGAINIKLNKSWWSNVVNQMALTGNYYYANLDSLVKGLLITVANPLQLPGQGGILYLNMANSFSGIYFYYHGSVSKAEYYVYYPVGTNSTTYFNRVEPNYATAPFHNLNPTGKNDSIPANNLVYIQSGGGAIGRINFPNLAKNWSKLNPIVINEAEVDIPVNAQDATAPFIPPTNLYLLGTTASGQGFGLPDEGQTYYGGTYNAFNNTYTFVITEYIQAVISKKDTDRGLFIIPGQEAITANRVVLYGAQHGAPPTAPRTRLRIYYTPLKPN